MQQAAAPLTASGRLAAWLGGVAFVLSLAYFVYSYAVRFGREPLDSPYTGDALGPLLVNIALFSLFALHHSLMARSGARRWLARRIHPALERSAYVWIASALFVITCAWWQPLPGTVYVIPPPWHALGWAAQGAGVLLTMDAARSIDLLDLAGIRQTTGRQTGIGIQARGAYRFVRHPIYLGWALMTFGAPVMTATRFSFACISTLYLIVAIPFEERSLVEAFGDEYREYRRRVRWRMLPGVY